MRQSLLNTPRRLAQIKIASAAQKRHKECRGLNNWNRGLGYIAVYIQGLRREKIAKSSGP